ncbi:MAG: SDR family oxidoreductase [Candidatus Omnitrophica bacterium]|nr:SDR family oxidoreductase [Candidatus Omnitrophota bacterium]
MVSRKKVAVVTGGAGFLGSHLCTRLIEKGIKVICIDNLITGKLDNIRHLRRSKLFRFLKHDVSKYIKVRENVDYVLHLASPASPDDYLKFPIQTLKVGSLGTHNALGLARLKKARFLLASTSEIYGDPLEHPQKETYWGNVNSVGPRGVYDESKRFAESITLAYKRQHKMDVRIVRIFNTFGPRMRQDDGRAMPNFITQALVNKPITVYGKGTQTRSFCYVDDLIDGLIKLLFSNYSLPVNIGNQHEITILQLAHIIIKLSNSKSRIVFKALPKDDPKLRCPDISLAKRKLGWKPRVKLEQGIKRTLEDFCKRQ